MVDTEVVESVQRVRLSSGTVARIETELKTLGFTMPSNGTCESVNSGAYNGRRSVGDDHRAIEDLVERIVPLLPQGLVGRLRG
jgi:hypothetical protein